MDTPTSAISLTVPADLRQSQLVRMTVKQALELTDMPACWVYRLMLVLDELFMNAVKYGSSVGDTVLVEVISKQKGVHIRVSDMGHTENKEDSMTPRRLSHIVRKNAAREGMLHTSGRGLALIANAWTDKLSIRQSEFGGISVEVEKLFEHAQRDNLPATEMHTEKLSKQHEELVVHIQETILQPDSGSEFDRLTDVLSDRVHEQVRFECSGIGTLDHAAMMHLLELYLTVVERDGCVRWQNTSVGVEKYLKLLNLVD